MTRKDESPEEATNPYWSDELLAVLAEALGDEERARQALEDIIQPRTPMWAWLRRWIRSPWRMKNISDES